MAALEVTLAIVTLVIGLVFAYLGWGVYTTILRIMGAFVGGGFGLMLYRSGLGSELWHAILLVVIGAIIGALIAVFAQRIFVAFAGFFLGVAFGNMIFASDPFVFENAIAIAIGVVLAILFFVFFQIGVMVATAAVGAFYVANAGIVLLAETEYTLEPQMVFWVLLVLVAVTGFLRQRASYGTG